jgi:hypothetical protein
VLRGLHQVRPRCRSMRDEQRRLIRRAGSYLIIIKSLLPNVVASLYHDLSSPDTNPPVWALSGRIWISLVMVVLVPLSFLRRLDSLRHASYVALFSCGECSSPHQCHRTLTQFPVNFGSISCCDSDCVLFPPDKRDETARRDPPHQVHTQLYLDVPYSSFRFHLRTECINFSSYPTSVY